MAGGRRDGAWQGIEATGSMYMELATISAGYFGPALRSCPSKLHESCESSPKTPGAGGRMAFDQAIMQLNGESE